MFSRWFGKKKGIIEKNDEMVSKIEMDPVAQAIVSNSPIKLTNDDLTRQIANLNGHKDQIELILKQSIYTQVIMQTSNQQRKEKLEARLADINQKLDQLNEQLSDQILEISLESVTRAYERQVDPNYRLASSLAGLSHEEQAIRLSRMAKEMNDEIDENGQPLLKTPIPNHLIRDAPVSKNICVKLANKIGEVISYITDFFLTYKWRFAQGAALMKWGMFPVVTAGACLSVPSAFLTGPFNGILHGTMCLGVMGMMIYKDEKLQTIIRNFADGNYIGSLQDIKLSGVFHSVLNELGNGKYEFLTSELPILSGGILKSASLIRGLMNFKENPMNTADEMVSLLSDLKDSGKEYIEAFGKIQRATVNLAMGIAGDFAKEQVHVVGDTVTEGVKVVVGVAGEAAKTALKASREAAKAVQNEIKSLVHEVIDLDMIENVKQQVSESAGNLLGWVSNKIGRARQQITNDAHSINEIAHKKYDENKYNDVKDVKDINPISSSINYIPTGGAPIDGGQVPLFLSFSHKKSVKAKKSVKKAKKSVKKTKKSVKRKSVKRKSVKKTKKSIKKTKK
jgi:hypothetical protein